MNDSNTNTNDTNGLAQSGYIPPVPPSADESPEAPSIEATSPKTANETSADEVSSQGGIKSSSKQDLVEHIKKANNILVTVKANPTVDELAATIGLTVMLNKMDKRATAVFSGKIPSTIEFLQPDKTLESNTDSLRDFIIALDKSKADRLRYKVEDEVVRIYITPYRTSISENDLDFTQGDFNVETVIALGLTNRDELDQSILAHGRILHNATFITMTTGTNFTELGQINWLDSNASGLCEMVVSISEALQSGIIDEQIATALLTGIVSETDRFSNPKTTPKIMTMSAQLMAAGANQQLIMEELETPELIEQTQPKNEEANNEQQPESVIADDGTLRINHEPGDDNDAEDQVVSESGETTSVSSTDVALDAVDSQLGDGNNVQYGEESATDNAPPESPANLTSDINVSGEGVQYGNNLVSDSDGDFSGVLPTLEAVNSSIPASDTNPGMSPEEQAAAISIDKEGNLIRLEASKPKHTRVIQPLSPDLQNAPADTAGSLSRVGDQQLDDNLDAGLPQSAPSDVASNTNMADTPPVTPPQATGFVAYRLSEPSTESSSSISDVSGNLPTGVPETSQTTTEMSSEVVGATQEEDAAIAATVPSATPPPVAPPMVPPV